MNLSVSTCLNEFSNAAAWGATSFNVEFETIFGNPNSPSSYFNETFQYVYTIAPNGTNAYWLGSPTNYSLFDPSDDLTFCALKLPVGPQTVERGQTDDGTCRQALDPVCAQFIEQAASDRASAIFSNLVSQPVLLAICEQIKNSLQENITQSLQCAPYFQFPSAAPPNETSFELLTYTTDNESVCQFGAAPSYPGLTFFPVINSRSSPISLFPSNTNDTSIYDRAYRQITPLLTLFMPPANVVTTSLSTPTVPDPPEAFLRCPRVTNHSASAFVPPTLPSPSSTTGPESGLSAAAIGGLVAACVVSAMLIVGAVGVAAWRERKRRREQAQEARHEVDGRSVVEMWQEPPIKTYSEDPKEALSSPVSEKEAREVALELEGSGRRQ